MTKAKESRIGTLLESLEKTRLTMQRVLNTLTVGESIQPEDIKVFEALLQEQSRKIDSLKNLSKELDN